MLPKTRRRDRRTWLVGALALAGWLTASLTGFATPALARTCGSITIAGGTVSPGTGTPSTTFTFAVTVSDTTGTAPAWVRVRVHGTWSDLAPTGSDWTGGVLFTGTRELPVGSWGYVFRARTAGGTTCDHTNVSPSRVVVTAPPPPPPPTPTPTPTPIPTPKPTAAPDAEADRNGCREVDAQAHSQADREGRGKADPEADPQANEGADEGTDQSAADQGRDTAPDRGRRRLPEREP